MVKKNSAPSRRVSSLSEPTKERGPEKTIFRILLGIFP